MKNEKCLDHNFNIAISRVDRKSALLMGIISIFFFYLGIKIGNIFELSSILFILSFFSSTFFIFKLFIHYSRAENIKRISSIRTFTYLYIFSMGIFINQSTLLLSNLFTSHGLDFKFEYKSIFDIYTLFSICTLISIGNYLILSKKSKNSHITMFTLNSFFNTLIKFILVLFLVFSVFYFIKVGFFSNSFNINYQTTIYTIAILSLLSSFSYFINDLTTYIFVIEEGKQIKTYLYFLLNKVFSSFGLFLICFDIII